MKRTSRLLVAAVAVLGVLLATAGFTSEPGAEAATAAFILDILPQLMGGPPKNSFPRLRRIHPPAASASPRQWPAPPLPAASAATAHNVRGARRVRRRHLLPGPCRGCRAAH